MESLEAMPKGIEALRDPAQPSLAPRSASPADVERFRSMVDTHYAFVWRSLRRLGVAEAGVDDAAQHVFWVASSKLAALPPGAERTFLYRTAMGVAANARRSARLHRREIADGDVLARTADATPTPEELLRLKQARALLDQVLDAMDPDQRSVFALAELEGMTMPEIAEMLDVPTGTAASRLRRAREVFQEAVARLHAREAFRGAP
jgi:RNA polymerase sigma-70 factor (ECF subfamily)